MNLKNYKWKRGVLLIATALSFGISLDCCSKPRSVPLENLVREQDAREIISEGKKESLEFAVNLSSDMSREDIKNKLTELIGYRIEKEVREIADEKNFEYYAPLSELGNLKKSIRRSYTKGSNEIRKIQNDVLALVYNDALSGSLERLTEGDLGKYYPKVVDYKDIEKINSDFYKRVIGYFSKMKDKKGDKLKEIEEKEKFFEIFFKREREYFRSIYNQS